MNLAKKLIAMGLTLSLTTTMVLGSVVKADDVPTYKYKDDYTYGYSGAVVAYKDGVKKSLAEAGSKVYSAKTDDPFTPLESQAWDTKNLELTPGVAYTTSDGKVNPITSMLTNFNFIADPTAIDNSDVDGKLYVYGTTEGVEWDTAGQLKQNGYNNHSLTILSTKDMVNWTHEGYMDNTNLTNLPESSTQKVTNKWAPSKGWAPTGLKHDGDGDGEDEYYLFYTNSGAVGYVQSDTPNGPWKDDLGKVLFSQSSPGCKGVVWCFDPAVLKDDKGNVYIYFGGGTTSNKAHSKTTRVCKLKFEEGTGKVEPDGIPQEMDPYYIFEDSEINQFNGRYVYSYCTNFDVPDGNKLVGKGHIAAYVSTDPMNITYDPDTQEKTDDLNFLGTILKNPSDIYGKSYNNHHHMQEFKGNYYMFYHSTSLENMLYHTTKDYRNLHVASLSFNEDVSSIKITPTYEGVKQIENFNPYQTFNATTTAYSAGVVSSKSDSRLAIVLDKINTGDWTQIKGVDFGETGVAKVSAEISSDTENGSIEVFAGDPTKEGKMIATLPLKKTGADEYQTVEATVSAEVTGVQDLFFVFRGDGYKVATWTFTAKEAESTPTPTPTATATAAPTATPAATLAPTATPAATLAPTAAPEVKVTKPVIKSVKNVKGKKALVTLNKKVSGANGYEVRYSLKKNMKSAKKVTIKKGTVTKATIKSLKKKKTYYVQARAYKKVDGKTYYSSWSAQKKVKITK